MSGIFKLLLTVLFGGILFWFILVNRFSVQISLNPFWGDLQLPLGEVLFLSVLFGFIWGALIVWLNGMSVRRLCRTQKKELKKFSEQASESA